MTKKEKEHQIRKHRLEVTRTLCTVTILLLQLLIVSHNFGLI